MGLHIHIKPNTYVYFAVLVFLIPIKWLLAWLFATAIHEICHWSAVKLCGGHVYDLQIGVSGVAMRCSILEKWAEFICIIFGPIGGLLPLLFAKWIPLTAICSLILSAYNLLPVLPLDGGRALKIMLGDTAFLYVQGAFFILAGLLCIYGVFILRIGMLPLVVLLILVWKNRKSPCK